MSMVSWAVFTGIYALFPLLIFSNNFATYHSDMYVKVAYDNFDNKRRYDDDDDCILQRPPRDCGSTGTVSVGYR